jgi:hypothetical protein
MYYRRKVILALLQLFNGRLPKSDLQKLMFLATGRQSIPSYEFVPSINGCFSYSLDADLEALVRQRVLRAEENTLSKSDRTNYLEQLEPEDAEKLQEIKLEFGRMSGTSLTRYTYLHFPFCSINSKDAREVLSSSEMKSVDQARPVSTETILYTIGYEGNSLENYLVRLISNDVKVLVDVRNNPLSMKFGFSKNQLKKFCESLGIIYLHFPEVGIQSDRRKKLTTQKDYDALFELYRITDLPKTHSTQEKILQLLIEHQRIALTCFEADVCQCHRKYLAESIAKMPGFRYEVRHI